MATVVERTYEVNEEFGIGDVRIWLLWEFTVTGSGDDTRVLPTVTMRFRPEAESFEQVRREGVDYGVSLDDVPRTVLDELQREIDADADELEKALNWNGVYSTTDHD